MNIELWYSSSVHIVGLAVMCLFSLIWDWFPCTQDWLRDANSCRCFCKHETFTRPTAQLPNWRARVFLSGISFPWPLGSCYLKIPHASLLLFLLSCSMELHYQGYEDVQQPTWWQSLFEKVDIFTAFGVHIWCPVQSTETRCHSNNPNLFTRLSTFLFLPRDKSWGNFSKMQVADLGEGPGPIWICHYS